MRMMPRTAVLLALLATTTVVFAQESRPTTRPESRPSPTAVDLRAEFTKFGLAPRSQGARPTCSVFTVVSTLEFALAKATGEGRRFSPEFANRAKNLVRNGAYDGGFFHDILDGLAVHGIVAEASFPYTAGFDPKAKAAIDDAALAKESGAMKALIAARLKLAWIKPWSSSEKGLDDAQFARVKDVLARGLAVGTGMAHSRTLVGYRDDAAAKGGGVFLTLDSGSGTFSEVTFEFVKTELYDVFCFEIVAAPKSAK